MIPWINLPGFPQRVSCAVLDFEWKKEDENHGGREQGTKTSRGVRGGGAPKALRAQGRGDADASRLRRTFAHSVPSATLRLQEGPQGDDAALKSQLAQKEQEVFLKSKAPFRSFLNGLENDLPR